MIELTAFSDLLRMAGKLYWLLAIAVLVLAITLPQTRQRKIVWTAIALLLFWLPVGWNLVGDQLREREHRNRYEAAKARFDERCKTAGEKIVRTVENVEGILLLKVRKSSDETDWRDPMWADAAAAQEESDEGYIRTFLAYARNGSSSAAPYMTLSSVPTDMPGYRYVDVVDERSGKRYRYRKLPGRILKSSHKWEQIGLSRELTDSPKPQYSITFEDILNKEDREYWIAGTVIKIIDNQTNELLAQQTKYSFEAGFGSLGGHRQPWLHARRCPVLSEALNSQTRFFVSRVLRPIKD